MPRRASYVIGSGTVRGTAWRVTAYVGPWGTCFVLPLGQSCMASNFLAPRQMVAASGSGSAGSHSTWYVFGEAAPPVSYLIVTMPDGSTERVRVVPGGARSFFAYATVHADRKGRWAAYSAGGRRLAGGTGTTP